jgi:putative oxidoreductase
MIRFLNRLQPWALTLIRLALGVSMVVHGWEKLIPAGGLHRTHPLAGVEAFNRYVVSLRLPYWLGYVSVATEFFGGLFLIIGLLTRFWAVMVAGNMLVALITVGIHQGFGISSYIGELTAMALLLVTAGSGALSLDRRLGIS